MEFLPRDNTLYSAIANLLKNIHHEKNRTRYESMLFSHAADVMQATAYFLERENVRSLLDPVDEVRHKQILEKISLENIARRYV